MNRKKESKQKSLNAESEQEKQKVVFDENVPSREEILAFFRERKRSFQFDDLLSHFGLENDSAVIGLDRRVGAMLRDAQLTVDDNEALQLPKQDGQEDSSLVKGVVQGHRDGFGFLIPEDRSKSDLFLAPREMRKVIHGDRVLARITGQNRGKQEGTILEILHYGTLRLVGRLLSENGQFVVVPEDQRIKHDVVVAKKDTMGASTGQVVHIEITRQPTRQIPAQGKVIEVLGEIDDPGMEIEIAVRKFNVPEAFSPEALQQANKLPDEVRSSDLKQRVDLRDVPLITIDGADARDFDDAVYAELIEIPAGRGKTQAWRLLVAIADVSHYVRPNDALDQDAAERGTSVYFPRRVIPMLPEKLSNGLCSLNPEVDRLALVCDMVIPVTGVKKGQVKAYQFYEAVISSHARVTYDQAWNLLQQPNGQDAQIFAHVAPQINDLHELFELLHEQRTQRGAMDFDTVETKIIANELGKIEQIVPMQRNNAHRLIEECMLAANTCAADFIQRSKKTGLYRVHEGPTPTKLKALKEYLKFTGLHLGGGSDPTSLDYAALIKDAKPREDYQVIQSMVLRSMQQAIYSPDNGGHFGLAYDAYTHFTSPIRRYPDLLTHRVIKSVLNKREYLPQIEGIERAKGESKKEHEHAIWERLGTVLSAFERRADEASYDVQSWLKCWFMRDYTGEVFSGKITGVTSFGVFVTLDSLYIEGMIHVSQLNDDFYHYNEQTHELVGERTGKRYRLTDAINVQVSRVDLEARKIEFSLIKPTTVDTVRKVMDGKGEDQTRHYKKAAKPKPKALKGTTASQRRASQKKAETPEKAKRKRSRKTSRKNVSVRK